MLVVAHCRGWKKVLDINYDDPPPVITVSFTPINFLAFINVGEAKENECVYTYDLHFSGYIHGYPQYTDE